MIAPGETYGTKLPEDPGGRPFWPDFMEMVGRSLFSQAARDVAASPEADAAVEAASEAIRPRLDAALGMGQAVMGEILGPIDAMIPTEGSIEDTIARQAAKAAGGVVALALAA